MTQEPNHLSGQQHNEIGCYLDRYQKGLELAEAGKHQEALDHMQQQLRTTPENADILNDTGAILHCLGRSDEAIDHILKARSIQSDSAEIVWNLAEAYLAIGKASEAMELFDDMDRMGVLNADVLNRTAEIFVNQQNKGDAIEMLLRSLRIWPDQEMLHPMIEVIRSKRPKVAIFSDAASSSSCLDETISFVKERFYVCTAESPTDEQMQEMMKWSDISWFERCPDLAATASGNAGSCKIIIRIGRYQEHERSLEKMDWTNVAALVAEEGECDSNALIQSLPDIEDTTSIVALPKETNVEKCENADRPRGKNISVLSEQINRILIQIENEIESQDGKSQEL
jgi:tetratricopeptide (TPR) repeat protein